MKKFVTRALALLALLPGIGWSITCPTPGTAVTATNTAGGTSVATAAMTDTNTGDAILILCSSQFAFVGGAHFKIPTTTSALSISSVTIATSAAPGGTGAWVACTGAGGFTSKTFTCNWDSTGPGSITVIPISNTACTNGNPLLGIGAAGTCTGSTGTTATCSKATTANNSWMFGGGEDPDNAFTPLAGTSQTMLLAFNDAGNAEAEGSEKQNACTATSGTSVTMNFTGLTSGDRYNSLAVEVLGAAGGAAAATGMSKFKHYEEYDEL